MASGFSRAGKPAAHEKAEFLQPLNGEEFGDLEIEGEHGEGDGVGKGDEETMEKMNEKYENLKNKMEEFFDDDNGIGARIVSIGKTSRCMSI